MKELLIFLVLSYPSHDIADKSSDPRSVNVRNRAMRYVEWNAYTISK